MCGRDKEKVMFSGWNSLSKRGRESATFSETLILNYMNLNAQHIGTAKRGACTRKRYKK